MQSYVISSKTQRLSKIWWISFYYYNILSALREIQIHLFKQTHSQIEDMFVLCKNTELPNAYTKITNTINASHNYIHHSFLHGWCSDWCTWYVCHSDSYTVQILSPRLQIRTINLKRRNVWHLITRWTDGLKAAGSRWNQAVFNQGNWMSNGGDLRSAMDGLYDQSQYSIQSTAIIFIHIYATNNKTNVNTICRNACTGVYAFDSTTECLFVYVVCREIEWHKN